MTRDDEMRARAKEHIEQLEGDELRVVLAITKRLCIGKRQYGRLDIARDGRNWQREIAEEVLDQAVYTAIYLLKENDKK